MQNDILSATIAVLLLSLGAGLARAQDTTKTEGIEPQAPKEKPLVLKLGKILDGKGGTASSSVTVNSDGTGKGKAVITIEVNGKTETREIDLGNATEIKVVPTGKEETKAKRTTFLGVAPEELPEELAAQLPVEAGSGLLVRNVTSDSPAARAGLQKNDVLVKADDLILTNPKQLQKLVGGHKPGDTMRVEFFRKGQRSEVEAKLAEHEESELTDGLQSILDGLESAQGGKLLRLFTDPLTIKKKAIIVDKDGKVLKDDDTDADRDAAIKRLAEEVEHMRDQASAAQKKAAEAIQHAERAAKEAAEIARKQAVNANEQVEKALRKLREEMEKAAAKGQEGEKSEK